ncbi:MAG: sugar ABC transporter permease [Paenibacillus macerans]|uniref:ABC transporter permease subunit n=1 Tax=Paenibacillus macerans TaxID=44252 RepID=A0A090Y7W0_PAEMA|nr:sugar ABC transporter permease [Paenibacillus macerans]KFM94281.1 binding--dependent transport system inner membrane component family protein [Paenibacillus macerans]MBS5911412.1 sugar ABC transporter permease [Paenibacillus macerans]MCY7561824.1 sugar ABC transporter permease [Paenibacillus macerans]MDU7472452.1 sugar ABC transporter permease [Paenibacillus macerans]MEC0139627.1 sugar ABC transporter permease [Paenibacillus macerans]
MSRSVIWGKLRPYVLIAPAMAGIGLFVIYPVAYLVYLSFFKYNLMNKARSKFIGLDNFEQILTRGDFYKALGNTAVYTLGVVVLTMALSLLIAVWLNRKTRINALVQAGIFTPHIVSIVSIALVWLWLMDPDQGLLNFVLRTFGLPPSEWLQSSGTALFSVIIVSVWQSVGYYALIIVAALQSVPPSIYEAAALDNASRFKVFWKITLPMISPQLFFILIIMTIGSFKVFDTVKIMTGGGPNDATNTLVYYIYGFRTTNIGYSAATGTVLMAIIGVLTFIYFRLLAKKVHYQ